MTQRLQHFLSSKNLYKRVEASFLEEAPFFRDKAANVTSPMISIGLFVGGGTHALDDIQEVMQNTHSDLHVYGGTIGDHHVFKQFLADVASNI